MSELDNINWGALEFSFRQATLVTCTQEMAIQEANKSVQSAYKWSCKVESLEKMIAKCERAEWMLHASCTPQMVEEQKFLEIITL